MALALGPAASSVVEVVEADETAMVFMVFGVNDDDEALSLEEAIPVIEEHVSLKKRIAEAGGNKQGVNTSTGTTDLEAAIRTLAA